MDERSRISYRTRQGDEPQEELSALRDIYAVALAKAAAKKKAARRDDDGGGDPIKGEKHDRAKTSIPEAR